MYRELLARTRTWGVGIDAHAGERGRRGSVSDVDRQGSGSPSGPASAPRRRPREANFTLARTGREGDIARRRLASIHLSHFRPQEDGSASVRRGRTRVLIVICAS